MFLPKYVYLLFDASVSLSLLIIAVTVYISRHRSRLNIYFALFALSVAAWIFSNFFSNDTSNYSLALVANSVVLMTSLLALMFMLRFVVEVTQYVTTKKQSMLFYRIPFLGVLLSLTPHVVAGIEQQSDVFAIKFGGLAPLYFLSILTTAGAVLYVLGKSSAQSKRATAQTRLLRLVIPFGLIALLVTNFIVPAVFGQFFFTQFGTLPVLVLVGALLYSIVRHGLFDIRLAAVRTVAYALSIVTMASIYFALAYIASVTLFRESVTTGVSMSPVNIALALILAFVFQPIKQFFDRVTNQIFYRDRYDTNEFITRLGRILTSTTRLHDVIEKAGREIATTLKAGGSMIVVYRDHHADAVASWRMKNHFTDEEHDHLKSAATHFGGGLLVVESLQRMHTHEARRLHALLAKRNVAVVLPLVTVDETIGYLLLEEQMGSGYAKRDLEVLEAIADSLVIAIQNARSVQVVRDLNTHLEQRVNSATKELRASNKRLVELDATKDEFVSMASHQLRTPLTSIKGYLSMVLEGDVGKITPDQRQLLSEAFTSSERMVHLIGDFLNVSRLQTGKFVIDRRETDLSAVVSQEVASMKQIAEAHGMSITYRKPSVFPQLYIDDNKLRQVIMNFIDNAIYYSPESRAPIKVKLSVEDGDAVFRVMDRGMGVPAEVQKQLFGKFFRAENARKQRPDGTGIGLYLAKKVIDGHSGKLVFESVENKGSTFGFRLPIKKLSKPPLPAEDETKNTP